MIPGHSGPVKAVDWIEQTDRGGTFVSASHDQVTSKLNTGYVREDFQTHNLLLIGSGTFLRPSLLVHRLVCLS